MELKSQQWCTHAWLFVYGVFNLIFNYWKYLRAWFWIEVITQLSKRYRYEKYIDHAPLKKQQRSHCRDQSRLKKTHKKEAKKKKSKLKVLIWYGRVISDSSFAHIYPIFNDHACKVQCQTRVFSKYGVLRKVKGYDFLQNVNRIYKY